MGSFGQFVRLGIMMLSLLGSLVSLPLRAARAAASAAAHRIRYFDDNDVLPGSYRLGLKHDAANNDEVSLDGLDRSLGLANLRAGLEWKPLSFLSARLGYKTDMPEGRGQLAGLGAVLKLNLFGQSVSYACLPFDRGTAHYLSLTRRFGWVR